MSSQEMTFEPAVRQAEAQAEAEQAVAVEAEAAPPAPELPPEIYHSEVIPFYLLPNCVKVIMGTSQYPIEKTVTYTDFARLFQDYLHERNEEDGMKLQLPQGTFFVEKTTSGLRLCMYFASCDREVLYRNSKGVIRTPNVIISVSMSRNGTDAYNVSSVRYFCTNKSLAELDHSFVDSTSFNKGIFRSPFWNTYEDGRMCYGENVMPMKFEKGNLRGLSYYYNFLFTSPFNTDLGVRAHSGNLDPTSWFTQLKGLVRDDQPFPYDVLRA